MVIFLIDTGSSYSALSEKDAILLGIDCSSLNYAKGESISFAGTFKTKMINMLVVLTFRTGVNELRQNYSSGFRVICIPTDISPEQREKMLRYTPSVLGMDILSKFEIVVNKKRVELTYNK